MVQLVSRASDVRVTEINLSQVITSTSVTVAAFPIISTQGSTDPLLFTNGTDWVTEYGNPNPSISMTIQSGINYFTEGNQAWGLRVVGSGALYAGVLLYVDNVGLPHLVGQSVSDPINDNLQTFVASGQQAVALFYPNKGPGSYGDNYSIQLTSASVVAPTGLTGTAQTGSGSMPDTTYTYQVSALSSFGESIVSSQYQLVLSGLSVPVASITLNWNPVVNAIGYNVYGRVTGGTFGLLTTVGGQTTTFVDTGTITPNTGHQPITSGSQVVASNEFTVSVYDNTQPNLGPLETWLCTLTNQTGSDGTQMELTQRINPFSNYIQVASNVPALLTVPSIGNVASTAMTGGNSGTTPTSYQIAEAMQVFTNKSLYGANVFVNCGITDPVYQLAIDTLVQGRGDAVSLLDVPSASQQFQASIDYRNLSLNLNSTYSALFGPDLLQSDLINGQNIWCPPSGWAAALCARTDRVANPAYSIAGLNRGLLNVLQQRYSYDDGQATALFNSQVSYTRTFVGQGIALWEQLTLAGQYSALSWLSVRRITNVIKVALYNFLLYALQEQDTDAVRRQIINSCSAYLDSVVNANGLSSYDVVCDNSNNTPTTANLGLLIVTVVIIPSIPIHEIQLQIVVSKQGVAFQETLAAVNGTNS